MRCLELQRGQDILRNKESKEIIGKEVIGIVKHNQNRILRADKEINNVKIAARLREVEGRVFRK